MHNYLKVEVLVSTMNRKCDSIVKEMNISGDCVIINQSNFSDRQTIQQNGQTIKFLTYNELGLSRSRNRAFENASGDICLLADDDLIYENKYLEIIQDAYLTNNDADIIVFDVQSTNDQRPDSKISNKFCRIGFIRSMKVASYRISFKRKKIIDLNITFDNLFGAGSIFNSGEENIFLFDCLKNKLKVYYFPAKIATVSHEKSTWFTGFNEQYFITKGALARRMFKTLDFIYILQFLFRKYSIYRKEISFYNAIKYMLQGRANYLKLVAGR